MYTTVAAGQPLVMPSSESLTSIGSYQPLSGSMMRVASVPAMITPGSPAAIGRAIPTSLPKERVMATGQVIERDFVTVPAIGQVIERDFVTVPATGQVVERDFVSPLRSEYVRAGSLSAPIMAPRILERPGSLTAPIQYIERVIEPPAVEYVSAAPVVTETVQYVNNASREEVRQLAVQLSTERAARQHLEAQLQSVFAQMNGVLTELATCKARLDKLDPPIADTPLRAATRLVEQRGNVQVNHSSGHVMILRPLKFEPRTTKDKPTAVFQDISVAEAVCKDIAELSNIFNCPMTIEGHTKGGESQFWQTLADNRARIVLDLIIDCGANPDLLRAQGKPGRLGKNEVRTEVFMDISNISDERAAVLEVDVVQNGRVVERDLYQAGHLVERDRNSSGPLMERDVVTAGGAVLEKDYYRRNTEEHQLVGLGGKVVEQERVDSMSVAVTRPAHLMPRVVRPVMS
mmetsp:Transcript_23994/g.37702  ORF Transcript_23994/g.37702 Transcript_23994/m.37702 type:complete len:461 (+) Transcript_23994:54-1436(+)